MSNIEKEIATVQAVAKAKLTKLRARERKEQQGLDLRVAALLRERDVDRYEALSAEARAAVDSERSERRKRARRAAQRRTGARSDEAARASADALPPVPDRGGVR